MSPGAEFGAPPDDPRFGNGVPAHLKPRGLAFIEMTGVSRPGIAGVDMPMGAEKTPETATVGEAPPEVLLPRAAALFRDLLNTLENGEGASGCSDRALERPAGAVQALAEAESLLQALDRPQGA